MFYLDNIRPTDTKDTKRCMLFWNVFCTTQPLMFYTISAQALSLPPLLLLCRSSLLPQCQVANSAAASRLPHSAASIEII